MNNHIFKLGDKVRVKNRKAQGVISKVITSPYYETVYWVNHSNKEDDWCITESELTLIKEPLFKIGDYVTNGLGYFIVNEIYRNDKEEFVYSVNSKKYSEEELLFHENELSLVELKPKFKVGDKIKLVSSNNPLLIVKTEIINELIIYTCKELPYKKSNNDEIIPEKYIIGLYE